MSSIKNLYLEKKNPTHQILILLSTNFNLDKEINLEYLENISSSVKKEIVKFSPTKMFPLLKEGDFFLSGTLPILKYILNLNPEIKKILMGKDLKNELSCEMWLNFISNNIIPIVCEINLQLEGEKQYNKELFEIAINDLIKELSVINEHLKFRTFITNDSIQICDFLLATLLVNIYNKILTKDLREKIPNVIRHLKYVGNLKFVTNICDKLVECNTRAQVKEFVEKKESEEHQKSKKELKKEKKMEHIKEMKEHKKEEKKEEKKEK